MLIQYVYPGSRIPVFSIPDPNSFHPGSRIRIHSIPDPGSEFFPSRIRIKVFKYFKPKNKLFLSSRIPDRILSFYPSRILDPGSRGQKGTGSRIRVRNTDVTHFFPNFRANFVCCSMMLIPMQYLHISLLRGDFSHCNENPIYVFPEKELRGLQSQFPHFCVCERFIYSQDRSTYFPAAE